METMPLILQENLDNVEELYNYIEENLPVSIRLSALLSSNNLIIRVLIRDKIMEVPFPMEIQELGPNQILKRENIRLKQTLTKLED